MLYLLAFLAGIAATVIAGLLFVASLESNDQSDVDELVRP